MSESTAAPTTTAPIDVVIVGAGIIGRNHAEVALRHPRLRVRAVVDIDTTASKALAASVAEATGEPEPAQYETLTEALAHGQVDLVAVCTPSGLHARFVEEAMAAGKHVVVEKPIEVALPVARHLTKLADDAQTRGQVVSVISQHRFDPASVAVADAVREGRFGRIGSAVASVAWWRSQDYYDSAGWRGTWALDGGGALMNQGIHTVDLLVWLLGRPVSVYAQTGLLAHERIEVEDAAAATIRFASGAVAVLLATTAAFPGLSVRLQIHGSHGSAVIDDDQLEAFYSTAEYAESSYAAGNAPRTYATARDSGAPDNLAAGLVPPADLRGGTKPADAFVIAHLRQYEDVVDAIVQGRPPSIGAQDGLLDLAVVSAVYLSAALGRPVEVDDVLAGAYDDVDLTRPPAPAAVDGPDAR